MKPLLALFFTTQLLISQSELVFPGADGHEYKALAANEKGAMVYFFISPYCSTSSTFMKEMNAIAATYEDRAAIYFVHSDADQKLTDILQHTEMNSIKAPVLLDKDQKLALHFGAKVTPESVVTLPDGKVAYQGRINDLYLGPTKRQRQATTKDLRDALDALLSNKPIVTPRTEAIGCKISGLRK